jgi:hypothetical protein
MGGNSMTTDINRLPLCINCKFCVIEDRTGLGAFHHCDKIVNLVDGTKTDLFCAELRRKDEFCGRKGIYFESKEKEQTNEDK